MNDEACRPPKVELDHSQSWTKFSPSFNLHDRGGRGISYTWINREMFYYSTQLYIHGSIVFHRESIDVRHTDLRNLIYQKLKKSVT